MICIYHQVIKLLLNCFYARVIRYWIYWVPAQYVDAIKDAILGKFQFF